MNHSDLSRYIGSPAILLFMLFLLSVSFGYAEIMYVDSGATTGANDGTSWDDAYTDLQAAIDSALPGDEIWVAAGTYHPTSWPNGGSEEWEKHFSLKNGVTVYGGFSGIETSLNERDVETNETILSGDIGVEGEDSDNCFHVFYHPEGTDLDGTAVLDGLTITGGNGASSMSHQHSGGGMYNYSSSPTLVNCTFSGNSVYYSETICVDVFKSTCFTYYVGEGGGMYNYSSTPVLENCTFKDNFADSHGGGMHNWDSSPTLTNCTFTGNSVYVDGRGGGMANVSSSPTLANCTFSQNSAAYGGGMQSWDSSPTLTNCTFSTNSASYGGGMHNDSSSPTLTNSIFIGNSAVYGHGGGMYNDESSPALSNCTFAGNSADDTADGMLNLSSSPTLTNCILWNSDAEDSENEVINSSDATPIFAYCDIRGSFNEGVWNESFGTDGGNNIDSDPLFVRNPGTNDEDDPGDLHLTAESPCIDAGDPSITVGQDMDGEARVFDGDENGTAIVDMGADEYVDADYDGIVDREDAFPNDPNNTPDTDGGDGGTGGSSSGGSSGGCFINTLFGAVE